MEIWSTWLQLLATIVNYLSINVGLADGLAIIVFTLSVRIICLPLSIKAALQSHRNRIGLAALQPELELLKNRFADDPAALTKKTLALYKERGIRFFDRTALANMSIQGVFGISMLQTLRYLGLKSSFLWIANLAKPDIALTVVVAGLTFFTMLLTPGTSEHTNLLLYFIPAFVSAFILVNFPSALAVYWMTSNVVTLTQQLLVRFWFSKKEESPGCLG